MTPRRPKFLCTFAFSLTTTMKENSATTWHDDERSIWDVAKCKHHVRFVHFVVSAFSVSLATVIEIWRLRKTNSVRNTAAAGTHRGYSPIHEAFLDEHCKAMNVELKRFTPAAVQRLMRYPSNANRRHNLRMRLNGWLSRYGGIRSKQSIPAPYDPRGAPRDQRRAARKWRQ
jgi:hypothetical protein